VATVEAPKLKAPNADPHLQGAGERVKAAAEELERLGIARHDGTRISTELPKEMQGGAGRDFGGWRARPSTAPA
jgi:hypothetical protein